MAMKQGWPFMLSWNAITPASVSIGKPLPQLTAMPYPMPSRRDFASACSSVSPAFRWTW